MIYAISQCPKITPNNYNKQNLNTSKLNYQKFSPSFEGISKLNPLNPVSYFCNKLLQRSMIISRSRNMPMDAELLGKVKNIIIKTIDNKNLQCWDINPNNAKEYILFLHGMSQNITHNQSLYKELSKKGYGILALEYRGFGTNKKTRISENLINLDVNAALEYLKSKTDLKNIRIIGHSAGSALAVEAGRKHSNLKTVILVSPINGLTSASERVLAANKTYFPNLIKKAIKKYPNLVAPFDKIFQTEAKISNVDSPTYIIHSQNDKTISIETSKKLSEKAKNLVEFIKINDGGHRFDNDKIKVIMDVLKKNNEFSYEKDLSNVLAF